MEFDEKLQFIQNALEKMAWHTYPYVASVVGVESDGRPGLHVGTAFRIVAGNKRYILTAAHVIAEVRTQYPRFAISAARNEPPCEFHGEPQHRSGEYDIAIYDIPTEYPLTGIDFWPITRMDTNDQMVSSDFLFTHGFPYKRSYTSELLGGIHSRSFPYGAMRVEEDLPSSLPSFEFALDFDPSNFLDADGNAFEWLDPHGMSGSPVFRLGLHGQPSSDWTPAHSKAIGILTKWLPDDKLIVATKWQQVLDLIGVP